MQGLAEPEVRRIRGHNFLKDLRRIRRREDTRVRESGFAPKGFTTRSREFARVRESSREFATDMRVRGTGWPIRGQYASSRESCRDSSVKTFLRVCGGFASKFARIRGQFAKDTRRIRKFADRVRKDSRPLDVGSVMSPLHTRHALHRGVLSLTLSDVTHMCVSMQRPRGEG